MASFDLISLVNQGKSEKEIMAALIDSFNTSEFHSFLPDSFEITGPTPTNEPSGSDTKAHIIANPGYGLRGETDITYNKAKLKDYFISLLGSVVHREAARGETFDDILQAIEEEYDIKINREFFSNVHQQLDPDNGTEILKSNDDSFVFSGDYTVPLIAKEPKPTKIINGGEDVVNINITGTSESGGATLEYTVDWGDGVTGTFYIPKNLSRSNGIKDSTIELLFKSGSDVEVQIFGEGFTELEDFGFYGQLKRIYFKNASNLTKVPDKIPSCLISFKEMFKGCINFDDKNVINWDTHRITNMSEMFYTGGISYRQEYVFNQPLNNWDVSNVTDMSYMFYYNGRVTYNGNATFNRYLFNQPLNNWDVSNVTDMSYMFSGSRLTKSSHRHTNYIPVFNQDISMWNVENVTTHKNFSSYSSIASEFLPHWS